MLWTAPLQRHRGAKLRCHSTGRECLLLAKPGSRGIPGECPVLPQERTSPTPVSASERITNLEKDLLPLLLSVAEIRPRFLRVTGPVFAEIEVRGTLHHPHRKS